MAEIEDGAQAALALVLRHHAGLDFTRTLHGHRHQLGVAVVQRLDIALDPGKVPGVGDGAVLDHLGHARGQFARGQRAQRVDIGDHRVGLVEGADHVLAERVVDAGLAAH
ncbi:hypothetical protein FQZ97_903490 [compost metagenome]